MKKHSWVSGDFRGRAAVRLAAKCLAAGLRAGLLMYVALPALAAPHPVHYTEQRELTAHHERVRPGRVRHVAQAAKDDSAKPAGSGASRRGKGSAAKGSASKTKTGSTDTAQSTKPAPKAKARAKRHRLPPEDEADNDPLVMHRVHGRRSAVKHEVVTPRAVAANKVATPAKVVPEEAQVAAQKSAALPKALSGDDFVRAAGGEAAADARDDKAVEAQEGIVARGESHPDDDERLPMKPGSGQIVATVSATPEPVAPLARSAKGRKAAVMPEDHDARQEVVEDAMTPMVLPTLRMRHGRVIMPAPLKGSWDVLVHQNTMADSEGLARIQDDDDLDRLRDAHLLLPLNDSRSLLVNEGLPDNRRYARPWAVRFAEDMGKAYYSRFHQALQLNSAVRTVAYQLQLQRVNGNAAAVDGDGASPHLTGQALDFGKRGMSKLQLAWMRAYLQPLMKAGKIDVEEEFQQACFHISVYRGYAPAQLKAKKVEVAQLRDRPVVKERAAKVDDDEEGR